ncbi:MAG: hypothetical protein HGA66_12245, partial [Holophaga sp.]|nr:hypothetical protein [Holophaga sp.]
MITSFTSILVCSAALAAPQNEVAFQIPAGDLGTALKTFQAQAGCQVKVQAGLLKGLRSPGLTGTYRRDRALERLLKGTGILAVPQPGGDFELKPAGEHGQPPEITLGTVVVKGRAPATAGTRILTDVDISQRPTANRSLTEILELNPAVR